MWGIIYMFNKFTKKIAKSQGQILDSTQMQVLGLSLEHYFLMLTKRERE